jgi:hypothetical protein
MTRVEQHKMIDELRDSASGMVGRDSFDFEMYVKRDKDDEYLDQLSQERLESLYQKYVLSRLRKKMKNPFEK